MSDQKSQIKQKRLLGRIWPGKNKEDDAEMNGGTQTEARPLESGPAIARATGDESTIPSEELERLSEDIVGALKTVFDPEIPADIYELGLIYRIDIDDDRNIGIDMTLTAPACPVAEEMPVWVENAVRSVSGVGHVEVKMVFDPPWTVDRMSDEAKVAMNWY